MMEKFTYFHKSESPFSQLYPALFEVHDVQFISAEQYMFYSKAMLFGDNELAEQILRARLPSGQKALGCMVRSFDPKVWDQHCKAIAYAGNYEKFIQNEDLLQVLLDTKGTTLVKAGRSDLIWGVGLAEDDPRIHNRSSWQGHNLLGEILTQLREKLIHGD
ncbi:NADAR family protein [Paenibacillus albidus]|uniref:NADAR family protein n=1 Tax=Paenibacillus albidus TaxID=2041023 RepID=UPI0035CF8BA5